MTIKNKIVRLENPVFPMGETGKILRKTRQTEEGKTIEKDRGR